MPAEIEIDSALLLELVEGQGQRNTLHATMQVRSGYKCIVVELKLASRASKIGSDMLHTASSQKPAAIWA